MQRFESRDFDMSTLSGLKAAERFKTRMENQYNSVSTMSVGLDRVRITGVNRPQSRNLGQSPDVTPDRQA